MKPIAEGLVGCAFAPYEVHLRGLNATGKIGFTDPSTGVVTISAGGWLAELAKHGQGATANGAKKQIASGTGSGILFGGEVGVLTHELYHKKVGVTSTGGSVKPYSYEHLAIDRAVARDLCAAIHALQCDGQYADIPGVDPSDLFVSWCAEISSLNHKWENGPGTAAANCAAGGMAGAFDPDSAEANAVAAGLDLPTPAELAQSKENAIPACPCCSQTPATCCGA